MTLSQTLLGSSRRALGVLMALCLALGLGLGLATRTSGLHREPPPVRVVDAQWHATLPKDPEAATRAYLDRLPADARVRSDAYQEGGYWYLLWNTLASLVILGLLTTTGASTALCARLERRIPWRPVRTFLYAAAFQVSVFVLALPLAVAGGFAREHRYGMTDQTFGAWLGDQATGLAVGSVALGLLLMCLYLVIRRFPRSWWLWGAGVIMAFQVLISVLAPVVLDPLFNRYEPLPEGPQRAAVLSLARANGVPVTDVVRFDASKQTRRVSANVSGLLGTASVRLNDNLLKRCDLEEIRAVTAHEMAHFVLHHVGWTLLALGVLVAVVTGVGAWALDRILARWGSGWGLSGAGDLASFPVLAAVFTVLMTLATPVVNGLVRVQEAEADAFGINASRAPEGFAEVQLKLVEYRKADPGPVEEFLFYDHPSPRRRILAAMRWRAEQGN